MLLNISLHTVKKCCKKRWKNIGRIFYLTIHFSVFYRCSDFWITLYAWSNTICQSSLKDHGPKKIYKMKEKDVLLNVARTHCITLTPFNKPLIQWLIFYIGLYVLLISPNPYINFYLDLEWEINEYIL